jgi:hypothetical protein
LRRSGSFHAAVALSPDQIWYKLSFDFTKYNENEILTNIRAHRKTIAAQFNHLVYMRRVPNDPQFGSQWQWFNDGINGKTKGIDTKASLAWFKVTGGKTRQGKEIVIAVIDDGTESSHPDLAAINGLINMKFHKTD